MTSAIIDIICAIRNRSTFSPTHYQIGLLIAAIEDGDLIHVDEARALWVEDAAPAVAAE